MELTIYTGKLQYRDVDFSFVFDGQKLRLVPPDNKKHEIEMDWLMTNIGEGLYTSGNQLKMDKPFLIGKCNENENKIIFLMQPEKNIDSYNSVLLVEVFAYIICKYDREMIDKISFSNSELNFIYPVNRAYQYTIDNKKLSSTGVFSITTLDFDSTTTKKQIFKVDDKKVKVYFSVSRKLNNNIKEAPISLTSTMIFEFKPTDDYTFIIRLWRIAREFLQFLCYRKNIFLPTVELLSPHEGGKHEPFATMHIVEGNGKTELDTLKKGRFIKQEYISGSEGKILNDIANNLLYTRHFPNTYESGCHIDASSFIMTITAFEWEFHREYPEGVPKKEATVKVEKAATEEIQKLIESSSGKLKKKYQFLKKLVKSDSLQTEIIKMGEDFDKIIGVFGSHLYKSNGKSLVYPDMGERLADQRNHFAHGDLDKKFIGISLLDLIYLEYVIYALQLKHYEIDEKYIKKSINDLFHLNFIL
ncbi:MAG: hypothetical protein H7A30_06050 [Thermotogae bacterium]|nr:hypothetical protein [Flavobacteriales bacterium]MCP5455808.1 hypothetical protein [Thermotogota bacterium]